MVKLGVSPGTIQVDCRHRAYAANPAARIATVNNAPVVQLAENFDRAWRRGALALDRTGFTVEDRNRNDGLYFVRYVAPDADKKEPGFFVQTVQFGSSAPHRLGTVLPCTGQCSTVSARSTSWRPESSANAERIVRVIADDLK